MSIFYELVHIFTFLLFTFLALNKEFEANHEKDVNICILQLF